MNRKRWLPLFILHPSAFILLAALFASGCSSTNEVEVTGSVTQGGKSQEGVTVGFVPADTTQESTKGTRTNADGKFQLMLKPGRYTVTLSKYVDKRGIVPKE